MGKTLFIQFLMDVTSEKDVQNAVSESINQFGGIDILVANAGFASVALFEKHPQNYGIRIWIFYQKVVF